MLPEALAASAASVSAALAAATDACSPRDQGSLGIARRRLLFLSTPPEIHTRH